MNKPLVVCALGAALLLLASCEKRSEEEATLQTPVAPALIAAHTHGIVSREAAIRIRFADDMVDSTRIEQPLKDVPLKIKPRIGGTAVWTDRQTLEYRPDKRLEDGERYEVTVVMAKLVAETPPRDFTFSFVAIEQSMAIEIDGLRAKNPTTLEWQRLVGSVTTADVEHGIEVATCLTASQNNRRLPIRWEHDENRLVNTFTVDSIVRGDKAGTVVLAWDGKPIGVDDKGSRKVTVPPLSAFAVTKVEAVQDKQQYISIWFTDPLQPRQNLRGLIRVGSLANPRFAIDGVVVKVYGEGHMGGDYSVTVEAGIRNTLGHRLQDKSTHKVVFPEVKPQVRFGGSGVIVPTTQGTTIPVETVNLRTVVVEATRVFEDNVPQFFQVNSHTSTDQLRRVGRVIWRKRISLGMSPRRRNRWVRYGLDVGPLIAEQPGGLYHIKLYFTPGDIAYHCAEGEDRRVEELPPLSDDWDEPQAEASNWDYYQQNFDWQEYRDNKDNPCHPAFYMPRFGRDVSVSRNVMVSDIGLIAKSGQNDEVLVVATSIGGTEPLSDARLQLLDYQQQVVATAATDRNGMATLEAARRPFLVVARHNNQTGYLKLDNGSALAVSHFDVGGEKVQKGIKGFIYGERGVWRPGDSLFLTFILDDRQNPLPANHPVTFELHNARNQQVAAVVRRKAENGFHCFRIATDPDAPTGTWKASVQVGGVRFDKALKVETIKPNRLKITLDFGADTPYLTDGRMAGTLTARWLHGAVAKNLDADIRVTFSPRTTRFSRFTDYTFDDPVRTYETEESVLFEGKLDEQGQASVSAIVEADNASPGMLSAHFKTRVEEPGGGHSVDRFSKPFHPYRRYIGIKTPKGDAARGMLLTDTTHTVAIAALDRDGKPVASARVKVSLYKLKWRWWWEQGEESLADYVGTSSYQSLQTDTVAVRKGRGEWHMRVDYPQWGRYLVRAEDLGGKHITGKIVYIDWPGWAGRAQKDSPGGAAVLTFASDKQQYTVGETVMLTIPTGKEGRALVSIESGGRVLQADWVEARGAVTRYELTTTAAMAPNVYAHVTYLQPHLQVGNDLPVRLYGVIPIEVVDPATRLAPVLKAPDEFEPESRARFTVSEEKGRPMTYTVAIVDEGLLDLTRFATPDPRESFYRREALGVKTWDLYDAVAGAYGGKLEQMLAIGGGGEAEPGSRKANRFPPMVRFMGPFTLDKNKTNRHDVAIPRYIGSVRIMVVAGHRGAYGSTDKAVFVRKPLMVMGTLPRVLGPDEEVGLPVAVFALDKKVRDVAVSVTTTGPLSIVGEPRRRVSFAGIGDKLVNLSLEAGPGLGVATVSIAASGGGQKARQDIEIDVRAPGNRVVDVIDAVVKPGESWNTDLTLPGIAGTNAASVEVSRVPPINLGTRLVWLIRYPHGCIEQTTSSVFPQVYLNKLLKLSPEREKEVEGNIKAGIDRIRTFQTADGGFGYWPGDNRAQEWATSYAGHFLVEASRAGYSVAGGVLDQWKQYQRERALSWVSGPGRAELIQAYRLYTLALAGAPELGAMNRLKEHDALSQAARYRLAAAYHLAGQSEAATHLADKGRLTVKPYRELTNTFGSDLRDKAMILETLCLLGETAKAAKVAREISEQLGSGKWMSTQTTAYALVAMARFVGVDSRATAMAFAYAWRGGKRQTHSTSMPLFRQSLPVGEETTAQWSIENTGKGTIFPRVIVEGFPAPGTEKAAENGLAVRVGHVDADGRAIEPVRLEQGTDFTAVVTVSNTGVSGRYDEIALSLPVASGWEIHNKRMDAGDAENEGYDYRDIRDDRVHTYFDLAQGESKRFRIKLNASYRGRYYMPMVSAEAMYDATINARVPGAWVRVIESSE